MRNKVFTFTVVALCLVSVSAVATAQPGRDGVVAADGVQARPIINSMIRLR
jgi:hypothetical protein